MEGLDVPIGAVPSQAFGIGLGRRCRGISRLSPIPQKPFGRKVQPCCTANSKPLGGSVDASEHLRIDAEGDHGRARIVVGNASRGGGAAALDAVGATLGRFGLSAFVLVIRLVIVVSPGWTLLVATGGYLSVAVSAWWVQRWL
jgi:hypothetical protein